MGKKLVKLVLSTFLAVASLSFFYNCSNSVSPKNSKSENTKVDPSNIIPQLGDWSILLGNGSSVKELENFEQKDYFYTTNDGIEWVVFKAPNSGVTSPTSHNTRTELAQKSQWLTKTGGKLTGSLKVMHVSTSGDARVAASFSVVVGQIHSAEGHKNEPIKIFYKKFPGHSKGSVFWNYEINTEGDNSGRWDFSTAVWGHDMSVIGSSANSYPPEPEDGIALGEEFAYEINVYEGMMYLTFTSSGHDNKTFTKNLLSSEFSNYTDIPQQVVELYASINRDGNEKPDAYAGELQFFKLGAYNQTNGGEPSSNMVWSTGSEIYEGDVIKQYENGSFTEVWFRQAIIGKGTSPK